MERRIKTPTLFVFLFFVIFSTQAQNTEKQESLAHTITILQERYHIQFNYAEDAIEYFYLSIPDKNLSLKEALSDLETKTGLSFTMLSKNIVLVKPKDNMMVCGFIKDRHNLQPMAFATVQASNNSTTTNENGFFRINIEKINQPIIIRYLGYKTTTILYHQISKPDCDNIFLFPNFQSLSEVIVSNYITRGINKISNGSYEIDFSKFDILPGLIDNDVLQSVQAFPGIQSINETVSNINIRGGTHDQNLILWDEIKMYQSGHFFGLISMYNPEITQKVSLIKNGTSAAYTDGVSGSIKMQTNKYINTKFKGVVGVNLTNVNGFADFPIGKSSSIQVAARKSTSNFFETPTYKSFFDRISQNTEVENNAANIANSDKAFDFHDTSLRWIYKISEKDELRLNFINVYNELLFNENATINGQNESRKSGLTQNSIAESLHYHRVWNTNLQTSLEIYETDYKLKSENANILNAQRFLQENVVSETSIKLTADVKLSDKLQLLNGYHFVETEVTNLDDVDIPLFRTLVSEVVRTTGVFSEIGYGSLNKTTNLNFGMRYNYINKFKTNIFEPRLSLSQKFLNHFTLEILGEFKHQNTSQIINFQNDFLGIEKRRWQLSNNEDIPIIRSKQASMGINYSKNGWLLNIEGYFKKVDGITSQSQGFQNHYEFTKSSGSYEARGFDVFCRKAVGNFNSWVSYSFMDNTYLFKEFQEGPFPSNFDITHAITLGTAYSIKNLRLSAGFNWHSGKPTTEVVYGNEIVNGNVNYAATNSDNLKDYSRLDVSALYDFNVGSHHKANFGISIWNVLDRKNEINSFYRSNNGVVGETVQNSLRITPNAVLRVYF